MADGNGNGNGKGREVSIVVLLPSMLTIAAICAGLTAIRAGVNGQYLFAVQMILAAAVLDGIDGRLARLLKAESQMGAELDSLADFLNFGVAPALVVYFWALQDMRGLGWVAVLVYACCAVTRLARFNVAAKADNHEGPGAFFTGVPSPMGALLSMLPMYVSFASTSSSLLPDIVIAGHMVLVGLLMISRIPTWSFKTAKVSRENVKYFLVGFAFVGAMLLTYAWLALTVLCLAYVGAVIWALVAGPRKDI